MPFQTIANEARQQTKVQRVCTELTALAHELGPNAKLPTAQELRQQLGVSLGTLNQALGDLEGAGIIYRLHAIGIFAAPVKVRHIAVLCDPGNLRRSNANHSSFWEMLQDAIEWRADQAREELRLQFSRDIGRGWPEIPHALREGLLQEFRQGKVHGVLAIDVEHETVRWLEEQGVPLVSFAAKANHSVVLDQGEGVRLGVAALAARGCRRIAFWVPRISYESKSVSPGEWQALEAAVLEPFQKALESNGLEFDRGLYRHGDALLRGKAEPSWTCQELGYQLAREVLDGETAGARPDGILIQNDMMTHGAMFGLRASGIEPGRDLMIASHANRGSEILRAYEDQMDLLEYDPAAIVSAMFDMLENLMAKRPAASVALVAPTLRVTHESAPLDSG